MRSEFFSFFPFNSPAIMHKCILSWTECSVCICCCITKEKLLNEIHRCVIIIFSNRVRWLHAVVSFVRRYYTSLWKKSWYSGTIVIALAKARMLLNTVYIYKGNIVRNIPCLEFNVENHIKNDVLWPDSQTYDRYAFNSV